MFAAKFRKFFGMAPYHRKPTLNDLKDVPTFVLETKSTNQQEWFIADHAGTIRGGPYLRLSDAKGQLTRRIKNGTLTAGYIL